MTKHLVAISVLACLVAPLAACAPPLATSVPPTSTGPNLNRDPQSANSLPPGFETPHPLLPRTGNLGTTQVGP